MDRKHGEAWVKVDSGFWSNERVISPIIASSLTARMEAVWVANGMKTESEGRGSGKMEVLDGDNAGSSAVPGMKSNLISVKRLVNKGFGSMEPVQK